MAGIQYNNNSGFAGTGILNDALKNYITSLKGVKEWRVLAPNRVVSSGSYKRFIASLKSRNKYLEKIAAATFSSPSGYFPYIYNDKDMKSLGRLARSLKVDAVIVVRFDIGYEIYTSADGVGFIKDVVTSSVAIVDKNSRKLAESGNIDFAKRFSSGDKGKISDARIIFTKTIGEMYKNSLNQCIEYYVNQLK